jgi:rubrerythrin
VKSVSGSLSVWAQDLVSHLDDHMDSEREALRAYGEMVTKTRDARIGLLIRQILDDEVRHHQQFAALRDDLLAEMQGRRRGDGTRRADAVALVAHTEELLALEKADIRELRRLARQLRRVEDTAWRALLVEAMELDTRKHIKLLEGVRDLLRESTG